MMVVLLALLALQSATDLETQIAEIERRDSDTGPRLLGIGDDLYALARKHPRSRQALLDRASGWWGRAWPQLDAFYRDQARGNFRRIYAGPGGAGGAPRGWEVAPGLKLATSGERVHSGGRALRVAPDQKRKEVLLNAKMKELSVPAGKVVEASVWVLSDETDGDGDSVSFDVLRADGTLASQNPKYIPKDTPVWTRLAWTFTLEAGQRLRLDSMFSSRSGVIFVDDLSVVVDGRVVFVDGFER